MIKFCLGEDFDHWLFPKQKGSLEIILHADLIFFNICFVENVRATLVGKKFYDCMTFPPMSLTDDQ